MITITGAKYEYLLVVIFCRHAAQEICGGVVTVMEVYKLAGLSWDVSSQSLHIPYAKVMAMLVFVATIFFQRLPSGAPTAVITVIPPLTFLLSRRCIPIGRLHQEQGVSTME